MHLLWAKSDAPQHILNVVQLIQRHFNFPLARIRTYNANEYLTKQLLENLAAREATAAPTTPQALQENTISEQTNRTLMGRVRATIAAAGLQFSPYWTSCILDTVPKTNILRRLTLVDTLRLLCNLYRHERSPLKRFTLQIDKYQTFGEFSHIPRLHRIKNKEDPRTILVRYLAVRDDYHY